MSDPMIRRLKIKLIVTVMSVMTLVLGAIFGTLNITMQQASKRQTKRALKILALNDGKSGMLKRNPFDQSLTPQKPNSSSSQNTDNTENARTQSPSAQSLSRNSSKQPSNEQNSEVNTPILPNDIPPPPSISNSPPDPKLNEYKRTSNSNGNNNTVQSIANATGMYSEPFEDIRNYFSVKLDDSGSVIEIVSDFPIHYTDEEIATLSSEVFSSNQKTGEYSGSFNGVYYLQETRSYGSIIVFVDQRIAGNQQALLLKVSLSIYGISMLVSFILAWLFSLWAIKPVEIAFDKQKRFVADASHELKTPIAVIGANIDVLSGEIGQNKWLDYIKTENNRMSTLVKDLLYLAKYDNRIKKDASKEFNLSQAVENVALPFESVLFDDGKKLEFDVQKSVMCIGDENKIKQAVIILIDNAVKNSNEGGIVRVSVKDSGNKKIVSVWNSGEGIDDSEMKKIFERFYRIDSSRARVTGGYGLGLAIAKTIMDSHNGKILVTSEKGKWAEFSLVF